MGYDRIISRHIEDQRNAIISDTIDLINIPSVSENRDETKRALLLVLDKAKLMGFRTSSVLDNRVGVVEIGEGSETIGILAHVDVVEAEDANAWEYPPFEGRVIDDWILGRGAMDDKGPLIASLYAMKAVKDLDIPLHKKIMLIIGTQEETEWTEMREYVKNYPIPDYGFTPDGEFPLTNKEKGYADIKLSFKKTHGKGGDFEIVSLNGGHAINAIPSHAEAVLRGHEEAFKERFNLFNGGDHDSKLSYSVDKDLIKVVSVGISTHSCYPEKGKNAIGILCSFLGSLNLAENGAADLVHFISECIGEDVHGKKLGLYRDSEYIDGEYMHRTVLAPTLMKGSDGDFSLTFNFRTVYGTTQDDLSNSFNNFKDIYKYTFEYLDYMDPIYVSKEKPFLKVFGEKYESISGLKNEFALAFGTSYAKAMPNMVSFGPVFPGDVDFCHEANEKIRVDNLILCAKIYASVLAEIALNPISFK